MHVYTVEQWLLLFYLYCLCGWIWESFYVSCKQRQWVNRGFLHGPWLPIYGSGAILILFATLPVKDSPWGIALMGTLAATLLEYVTGAVMERIFRMRYWDYSDQPCNLHGYICLTSSLGWAGFSWLLVEVIHPPIDRLLRDIPFYLTGPLAAVLTVLFVWDVATSVRQALDLKELLTKLTEENEELRRIAQRAEEVAALADEEKRRFRERTELHRVMLSLRIEELQAERKERSDHRKAALDAALEERLRRRSEARLASLDSVREALEKGLSQAGLSPMVGGVPAEDLKQELLEALEKLERTRKTVQARESRRYRQAARILRGNPSARAPRHGEALRSLRDVAGIRGKDRED